MSQVQDFATSWVATQLATTKRIAIEQGHEDNCGVITGDGCDCKLAEQ